MASASPLPWVVYLMTVLASVALLGALLRSPRRRKNPPGPRPWPVFGNLQLLSGLPHQSFHKLSLRYGPIMQLRLGSQRVVVASSADMAEQFLKTHDLAFASRPPTAAGKYTAYNYSDMLWSPYGPYLRHARKLCLSELLSPKRLDSCEHVRVEEVRRLLRNLSAAFGSAVNLRDHLSTFSLNVVGRLVLGKSYTDGSAEASAVVSPEELKKILHEFLFLGGAMNVGELIPWIGFLDLQGYVRRMKALGKKSDRFFEHVLAEHEERRRRMGPEFVPLDMVDVLLQLADHDGPPVDVKITRDGIKAITQDLLAAGTDSMPVTVEWAIAEVMRLPRVLQKATEELDRVVGRDRWVEERDLPNLPYLEAISKEAMRLHPPGPLLAPHYSREDCTVAGYDIPVGTRVLVNIWAIGRDPAVWGDPSEFRPERFEGKAIDVKGNHFELLPFGAGRRMCPGYLLGIKLIQSNLANLVHGFRWSLPEGLTAEGLNMEETFRLSLPRKFPLVAVVEPRLPPHLYDI